MLNEKTESNAIDGSVKEMTRKKKRIYNPKTGRYYQIRQRSSSKGKRGTIMGTWSPSRKKKGK